MHAVFSTKERRPLLDDKSIREEMHLYLSGILATLDCQLIVVGGTKDHVHLLFVLSSTRNVAEIIKEVKQGSSLWVKTRSPELAGFAWQSGCGVFSLGFSQIESVRKYISGQEAHHRKVSFQDEFKKLLKRYEVEFDERTVWD